MKQIKKMSLSNVISKLTRNEMRNVMAGSGSAGCSGSCTTKDTNYPGKCLEYTDTVGSTLLYGCACFYNNVKYQACT